MLGLSKIAKILFFREPEVLETGMIMPHEKEKSLVYACIQKKIVYLQSRIIYWTNNEQILVGHRIKCSQQVRYLYFD